MSRKSLIQALDETTNALELGTDYKPVAQPMPVNDNRFMVRLSPNDAPLIEDIRKKLIAAKVKADIIDSVCDGISVNATPLYLSFTVVDNRTNELRENLTYMSPRRRNNRNVEVEVPNTCWLGRYNKEKDIIEPLAKVDTISNKHGALDKMKALYAKFYAEHSTQQTQSESQLQDLSAAEFNGEAPPVS